MFEKGFLGGDLRDAEHNEGDGAFPDAQGIGGGTGFDVVEDGFLECEVQAGVGVDGVEQAHGGMVFQLSFFLVG